ncbi:MAG: hypothetical protein FD124_3434, partial [Alphaproteobacteria bacterium]
AVPPPSAFRDAAAALGLANALPMGDTPVMRIE